MSQTHPNSCLAVYIKSWSETIASQLRDWVGDAYLVSLKGNFTPFITAWVLTAGSQQVVLKAIGRLPVNSKTLSHDCSKKQYDCCNASVTGVPDLRCTLCAVRLYLLTYVTFHSLCIFAWLPPLLLYQWGGRHPATYVNMFCNKLLSLSTYIVVHGDHLKSSFMQHLDGDLVKVTNHKSDGTSVDQVHSVS